jgi:hypothetical protein
MMGSFAEQQSMRFYICFIPKIVVESLNSHAFDLHLIYTQERGWIAG